MALDSAPRPPGRAVTVKRNLSGDKDCPAPSGRQQRKSRNRGAPFPASFTLLSDASALPSFVRRPFRDGDAGSARTFLSG